MYFAQSDQRHRRNGNGVRFNRLRCSHILQNSLMISRQSSNQAMERTATVVRSTLI
jgi:hypothetical protein